MSLVRCAGAVAVLVTFSSLCASASAQCTCAGILRYAAGEQVTFDGLIETNVTAVEELCGVFPTPMPELCERIDTSRLLSGCGCLMNVPIEGCVASDLVQTETSEADGYLQLSGDIDVETTGSDIRVCFSATGTLHGFAESDCSVKDDSVGALTRFEIPDTVVDRMRVEVPFSVCEAGVYDLSAVLAAADSCIFTRSGTETLKGYVRLKRGSSTVFQDVVSVTDGGSGKIDASAELLPGEYTLLAQFAAQASICADSECGMERLLCTPDYRYRVDLVAAVENTCTADADGNGVVDSSDFLAVIRQWGPCPTDFCAPRCTADFNDDGVVDSLDWLDILSGWGPCP
jgi:hypothetical protein